ATTSATAFWSRSFSREPPAAAGVCLTKRPGAVPHPWSLQTVHSDSSSETWVRLPHRPLPTLAGRWKFKALETRTATILLPDDHPPTQGGRSRPGPCPIAGAYTQSPHTGAVAGSTPAGPAHGPVAQR